MVLAAEGEYQWEDEGFAQSRQPNFIQKLYK